jgi:hypothetical protein
VNECGARSNCDKCVDESTNGNCGWCVNPGENGYCTYGTNFGPEPQLKYDCVEWTRTLLGCPGTIHWKFGIVYSCKGKDESDFSCYANVEKGGPCFLTNIARMQTDAEEQEAASAAALAAARAAGLEVIVEELTPEQIAEKARLEALAKLADPKSDDLCYWKEAAEKERCQTAIEFLCGARNTMITTLMLMIPSCAGCTFALAFFVGWEWLCACGAPYHIFKLRLVIFSVFGAFMSMIIFVFYAVSMNMFNGVVEKVTLAFKVQDCVGAQCPNKALSYWLGVLGAMFSVANISFIVSLSRKVKPRWSPNAVLSWRHCSSSTNRLSSSRSAGSRGCWIPTVTRRSGTTTSRRSISWRGPS